MTFAITKFERSILLALKKLGDNAYGIPIRQELEETTNRFVSFGKVYVTLERLEENGLVSSREGEKTIERGWRAKRYFKLTALGAHALKASQC